MGKTHIIILLLITSLLTSSCTVRSNPITPPTGTSIDLPGSSAIATVTKPPALNFLSTASPRTQPSSTLRVEPSTISGDFVLTNTSAPGTDVGIETMNILLEYRPSVEDSWKKIEVNCSFNPPAPTILKEELHVQYTCQYQNQLPADAEMRVTAQVKIFGTDEVVRLVVEQP